MDAHVRRGRESDRQFWNNDMADVGMETPGRVEKREREEIGNPNRVTIVRNSADA